MASLEAALSRRITVVVFSRLPPPLKNREEPVGHFLPAGWSSYYRAIAKKCKKLTYHVDTNQIFHYNRIVPTPVRRDGDHTLGRENAVQRFLMNQQPLN